MPTRLVLHVGLPKCGSTTLQDGLNASADALAAHNISFARLRPIKFVQTLASGERPKRWAETVGEELSDVVIFSSEFLCTLSPSGIEGFIKAIDQPVESVTVVFILRPLEEWTLSRMNQRAQALPGRDAATEFNAEGQIEVGLDVGDLDVWLSTWSAWVHEQSDQRDLLLLPLVGERPLARRFLDALNLADVELESQALEQWSNRSVSARAIELIDVAKEMGDFLSSRQGLDSIRDDPEAFGYLKRIIMLAKQWDRPADEKPSAAAVRSANKAAGKLRLALEANVAEPLLGEVLALVGTRAQSKRARKAKLTEAELHA